MVTTERSTLVGVFQNRDDAAEAVNDLQRAGFRDEEIGFVARGAEPEGGTAAPEGGETHTGERETAGAIGGGVVGGLLGAAAAALIPGIGPVLAGGILASALVGAGAGAAAGGLLGVLTGMGVGDEEARHYESEFQSGRTLVTVRADDRRQEAVDILERHGAADVGRGGTRGI